MVRAIVAVLGFMLLILVLRMLGTIFAYGQTGTGKTYTMEGERAEPEKRGIIPNSFAHVFGHIAKSEGEVQYVLSRVNYRSLLP